MNKKVLSNEMGLISSCVSLQMDISTQLQIKNLLKQTISWQTIIKQSLYHNVLPFLYYNIIKLNKSDLPKSVFSILKFSYDATLTRNTILWKEFCYLQKTLNCVGIKIIPLKGIILAQTLYCDIGLRPMADIDILVQEKDLLRAKKEILQLGYQKQLKNLSEDYWRRYQCHFQFYSCEKKIILELHWALAPSRPNKLNLTEVWERSGIQTVNHTETLTLSLEDTLLSLFLHNCKNISALQHLKLKNLCDIHQLITRYNHELDWEYILKKTESWKIKGAVYYIYSLTRVYFTTPWPAKITNKFHPKITQRVLVAIFARKLNKLSRFQAYLLIVMLADDLRDSLAMILMALSIILFTKK